MKNLIRQLFAFGVQQAFSCIFPALVFAMLGLSHLTVGLIPRYDMMLVSCITIQIMLYLTKIETADEVLVICVFHLLGLLMEMFKVSIGSWAYPEFAYTKVGGVPLYSGFMYASVASYLCQAWRRMDVIVYHWPSKVKARLCGGAIYLNFFTNHFFIDVRYIIAIFILICFWPTVVIYRVKGIRYQMPVVVSFLLIGFFIWLAENMATLLGAWKYAYQHNNWAMVDCNKISSWFFLVIVSFIIVAELKMLKAKA